jgi:ArsR family transcriptional regulator, arsenate/arsenite/antimonite-responsive transcriptional repressor
MNDLEKLARIFKVLSVDTRVRMVDMLKRRTLCVNALAHALDITPAAVSQHLRVLRDAEVVIAEKKGYFVHYRANASTLVAWGEVARSLFNADRT